jgi:DNA sulfur modification protein DndD
VLDEYVDTLRKSRLSTLEQEATRFFQALLSSAVYDARKGKIEFNRETYEPTVYLEDSPKDPRKISRGIQQLYALAMLGGLCRSARSSIPLVIDTPLSGLDDKNKESVLDKFFPQAAEQVILLSRPDEVGAHNLEALEGHVLQTCVLDFDASLHSTYVRQNEYF